MTTKIKKAAKTTVKTNAPDVPIRKKRLNRSELIDEINRLLTLVDSKEYQVLERDNQLDQMTTKVKELEERNAILKKREEERREELENFIQLSAGREASSEVEKLRLINELTGMRSEIKSLKNELLDLQTERERITGVVRFIMDGLDAHR